MAAPPGKGIMGKPPMAPKKGTVIPGIVGGAPFTVPLAEEMDSGLGTAVETEVELVLPLSVPPVGRVTGGAVEILPPPALMVEPVLLKGGDVDAGMPG